VGRRRNGPLLSTRDDDEKTATEERNEWDKKRKSAGLGLYPADFCPKMGQKFEVLGGLGGENF